MFMRAAVGIDRQGQHYALKPFYIAVRPESMAVIPSTTSVRLPQPESSDKRRKFPAPQAMPVIEIRLYCPADALHTSLQPPVSQVMICCCCCAQANRSTSQVDCQIVGLALDELELASLRGTVKDAAVHVNFDTCMGRGKLNVSGPRFSGFQARNTKYLTTIHNVMHVVRVLHAACQVHNQFAMLP